MFPDGFEGFAQVLLLFFCLGCPSRLGLLLLSRMRACLRRLCLPVFPTPRTFCIGARTHLIVRPPHGTWLAPCLLVVWSSALGWVICHRPRCPFRLRDYFFGCYVRISSVAWDCFGCLPCHSRLPRMMRLCFAYVLCALVAFSLICRGPCFVC